MGFKSLLECQEPAKPIAIGPSGLGCIEKYLTRPAALDLHEKGFRVGSS